MKLKHALTIALCLAACSSAQPTLPPLPTLPSANEPLSPATTVPVGSASQPIEAVAATPLSATATIGPTATAAPDAVPCPLTGRPVSKSLLESRRPILVQIGNSAPERPQFGLMQADLIFETIAEGGITRFSAIYLCQDAPEIAGVRSGRLVDLELLPMFDAIFVHVGASERVQKIFEDDKHVRDVSLDFFRGAPGFTQQPDRRRSPFDVFTSTDALYAAARDKAIPVPGDRAAPRLNFAVDVPSGGQPARVVTIKHHGSYWVRWRWDNGSQTWVRYVTSEADPQTEVEHTDAATGRPLTADNILIIQAPHEQTDIIEDSLQSHSVKVNLIGSGPATLFRDGRMFSGMWARSDPDSFFALTQANGAPMALRPGNTFIHLYPTTFQFDVQP